MPPLRRGGGRGRRLTASPERRRRIAGLLLAACVVVADQATKLWLIDLMHRVGPIEVTGFFNLVMAWNTGVSFGALNLGVDGRYVLVALSLSITAGLAVWLWRAPVRRVALALGAVIGGALGNVIDRLVYGAVADFFDLHVAGWHWPAFNIADAAIVLGVATLLLDSLLPAATDRK